MYILDSNRKSIVNDIFILVAHIASLMLHNDIHKKWHLQIFETLALGNSYKGITRVGRICGKVAILGRTVFTV